MCTRRLVLETLQEASKTEPDRKCFRLVGGVLVERTVKDVAPQLESQFEQIKSLLETLTSQYKTKVGPTCSSERRFTCVRRLTLLSFLGLARPQEASFAQWQRDNNGERDLVPLSDAS